MLIGALDETKRATDEHHPRRMCYRVIWTKRYSTNANALGRIPKAVSQTPKLQFANQKKSCRISPSWKNKIAEINRSKPQVKPNSSSVWKCKPTCQTIDCNLSISPFYHHHQPKHFPRNAKKVTMKLNTLPPQMPQSVDGKLPYMLLVLKNIVMESVNSNWEVKWIFVGNRFFFFQFRFHFSERDQTRSTISATPTW